MDVVRRSTFSLLILVTALLVAACGAAATPSPVPSVAAPSAPPATEAPSAPEPSASAAAFPVTLTDVTDTEVTLDAEPEAIVSLTPAATETLYAIGAGDRVVGKVEDIAGYPPEAADVPVVATFSGVDIEQIVKLEPDLVIAGGLGGTPDAAIEQLRGLDLPVLVVYAEDVEGVLTDIRTIGEATGEAEAAAELAGRMREQIDAVAEATADLPTPSVFYETGDQPAIYGVADDSFIAAMIELAGGQPVTTGSATSWEMPVERLVAEDPEVIVLGDANYGVSPESVEARPGWADISAVREGAIRPIDDIVVTRPGPRLAEGLVALARAIHPDADLPDAGAG